MPDHEASGPEARSYRPGVHVDPVGGGRRFRQRPVEVETIGGRAVSRGARFAGVHHTRGRGPLVQEVAKSVVGESRGELDRNAKPGQ